MNFFMHLIEQDLGIINSKIWNSVKLTPYFMYASLAAKAKQVAIA